MMTLGETPLKRKYCIGYDCEGNKVYVGDKVSFAADDGDCPYIDPYHIYEVGTLIREKRKLCFISDDGEFKLCLNDWPNLENFTKLTEK